MHVPTFVLLTKQIFINPSKTYQIYSFKLRHVFLCVGICGSLKEIDIKRSHIRRCDLVKVGVALLEIGVSLRGQALRSLVLKLHSA